MSFTVFLGNLPTWVTADDIKQWLAAEDLVADAVKVIRNHETQESKGFAFVEAPTNDEMQSIIRRFDRAPLEDRLLRANPAQPPKGKDRSRKSGAHRQSDRRMLPMLLTAPLNSVPTARSVAAGIASSHPAVRLLPSWRRSSNAEEASVQGLACPGGATAADSALHTCELKSQLAFIYPFCFQLVVIGLQRALAAPMNILGLGCLFVGSLLFAGTQDSDLNVNKRYTVDTVIVSGRGWKTNVSDQSDRGSARDCAGIWLPWWGRSSTPACSTRWPSA